MTLHSPSNIERYPVSPDDFIEKLTRLRDEYSDDIPAEDISGKVTHKKATHKVQRNWWAMLILTLEYMNTSVDGLPGTFREYIRTFVRVYTSPSSTHKLRTDHEDIVTANRIINLSITHLITQNKTPHA